MTPGNAATAVSAPAIRRIRPIVITGGAGFIGCNLAARLVAEGEHVLVVDTLVRPGVEKNKEWLGSLLGKYVSFSGADVRDADAIGSIVSNARGVFHFAAQVAVTSSIDDPRTDLDVNLRGTFNILEAARSARERLPVLFASTNKVYGSLAALPVQRSGRAYRPADANVAEHGISEDWPLSFHTPYGCSKGSADQYVLDYTRMFSVPAVVMRMSCVYGPRQCGTEDQGWVAHFAQQCLKREPIQIFGDGCQVRDVLHVDDAVEAYVLAFRNIERVSGNAFNLGGGAGNAVCLLDVLEHLGAVTGHSPRIDFQPWRAGDQRYFVSDRRAVDRALGLPPPIDWRRGTAGLVAWFRAEGVERGGRAIELASAGSA